MPYPCRRSLIPTVSALAILGASIIGWAMLQRREHYRELAQYHLGEMASFDSVRKMDAERADMFEGKIPPSPIFMFLMPVDDTTELRASEKLNARRVAYHAALSRKYQEAADRPWIAVEVDPPSP